MKKAILYFCFTFPFFAFAQEDIKPVTADEKETAQEVFNFALVEKKPTFPGCEQFEGNEDEKFSCFEQGIMRHISQNFVYPEEARQKGIEGRIFVSFIIEKNGKVSTVTIARGSDPLLDAEGVRVIKLLPKMEPAYQKGKPVRMQYTVPINAKLANKKK